MKLLLFDQNLSPRLVKRLTNLYPGSAHVSQLGLAAADDQIVWDYAKQHGYTIVTKDADFGELVVWQGFPPKVIWIRRGNCSTDDIEKILRQNHISIVDFFDNKEAGILTLF